MLIDEFGERAVHRLIPVDDIREIGIGGFAGRGKIHIFVKVAVLIDRDLQEALAEVPFVGKRQGEDRIGLVPANWYDVQSTSPVQL